MPRILDPAAHALRRDAFVGAAERLVYSKGYEQMSLQDVLDELDASRGAFYHYFESKVDLLEAVVERMVDAVLAELTPLLDDPAIGGVQKLGDLFTGIGRWKTDRQPMVLAVLRVWLSDENAVMREMLRQLTRVRITPVIARIVQQGIDESVFTVSSAEATAGVLVELILGIQEVAGRLYLARQDDAVTFEAVEQTLAAFTQAFERILGLAAGSLHMSDPAIVRRWFA
jgi:AcrR family transcriptional regulator